MTLDQKQLNALDSKKKTEKGTAIKVFFIKMPQSPVYYRLWCHRYPFKITQEFYREYPKWTKSWH